MLSKVLKGASARQIGRMSFASASVPVKQSGLPQSAAGNEEKLFLTEKLRILEARTAAAEREAYDAGRRQGEEHARAGLTPVIGRLNASLAELLNMRPELRRRAEKDAVELSLRIARRVLHRELSVDATALNALARVVFDRLARTESWQLTVHPQFADAIRAALPAGSAARVRIDADPSCSPGTLVVRSADGNIDASVESQLEEIGRGLTDRLTRI